MLGPLQLLLITCVTLVTSVPHASLNFMHPPNIKDGIYEQPVDFMTKRSEQANADIFDQPVNMMAKKSPHAKNEPSDVQGESNPDTWAAFDFNKLDQYMNEYKQGSAPEHNRIKRRARRRRGRGNRRKNRPKTTTIQPEDESNHTSTTDVPIGRRSDMARERKKARVKSAHYDVYEHPGRDFDSSFVEMPKDLYQAHLRPGVIFRIHMSEAILKMQYRNYGEDKDESVIEADVEYLRLTRKVINDEITKFEDLQWLIGWFHNRSELIQEHLCNTRYYTVGTPPTMFTHPEEYMKRLCLFDSIYIDHIPYVVGEDSSIMAAVAPPVLHCDAATCTSVPFIDSVMFDERLARTNVRTLTRCQASCRAHCRNDPDCLKRCSDRCLRSE